MSQVVIVSGPAGAGKSSVCEALAGRYDRTVHLETDLLYSAIRMGYIHPWKPGSERQNQMVSRAAAGAARAFAAEEFGVFIDGVIGAHLLPDYIEGLRGTGVPVHFVVLLPSVEEMLQRARAREKVIGASEDVYRQSHALFAGKPEFAACTIDTTGLSAEESADAVMAACGRGDCLVLSP